MSTSLPNKCFLLLLACAAAGSAQEQQVDLNNSSVKFNLPADSPVSLLTANYDESRATLRGGAVTLDLHLDLSLKNTGHGRVRGITMLVVAQEASAFGKASVARLIDAAPGETFPLRVDVRLVRPVTSAGPLVQVNLDGVLFDNLAFYGPNRLNSKRTMTFWETEARRARTYFKQILASGGSVGLQEEMRASLARQTAAQRLDVRMSRGRSVGTETSGHVAQFAFLENPESPVKAVSGSATTSRDEVRAPHIDVVNRSNRAVQYVEIAWMVQDQEGQRFVAGSVPAAGPDLYLPPGQRGQLQQDGSLRFSRPNGGPVAVEQMTGVVSKVEFTDGKVWVPRREALTAAGLLPVLAPSPEEQRLSDMFKTRGVGAVIEELRRY